MFCSICVALIFADAFKGAKTLSLTNISPYPAGSNFCFCFKVQKPNTGNANSTNS
jgi:hypothetical protein